ncbi:hypothetical protein V474_18505 [Novosphingobium barchaimii LL02]|uniref:Uncharacterized protein n=1 Tax=Novosphingobium barchaimii LL02 TaxID=1114963 RepID=A0A0J7XTT9_9SPHN|nr:MULTISPECIES: hypothetical protein [Novosphingobium]AXB77556.1 hypothetical protein TQ38_014445 [Novosphingobium sp. P6W]KIS33917.1 hypothetical protein TQ38_04360 [Novosphingobium sp. P6W]KMS55054.1 hypothetical protein V474_18505 [Novosphingobium barchaimii LL02]
MNDNRLIAVLALAIFVPGVIWAWRDYREGRARLMLFSRRRSTMETRRADDPRKFWTYTAFNVAICAVVAVFAVLLFFKPVE